MKKLLIVFVLLSGCVHLLPYPGDIAVSKSEFDGTIETTMEPALVYTPGASMALIKLSLMHNSAMKPDEAVMKVLVMGLDSFLEGENVKFNIDGEVVGLTSFESHSSPDPSPGLAESDYHWTSQRYKVNKSFIEKLLHAKRVAVRVELNKSYADGLFTNDKEYGAQHAFEKFYNQVFSTSL